MSIFFSCITTVLFLFTLAFPAFALTDSDGDGYFVDDRRPRYVDCNDSDSSVHPFTDDYCDGVDKNCNGVVDEQRSVDATRWYQDSDGDGYGSATARRRACTAPTGYVADNTDCNDGDASINSGVNEAVDGVESDSVDNNCDGYTDEIDVPDGTSMTLPSGTSDNHGYINVGDGGSLTFPDAITLTTESIYLYYSDLVFESSPVTITTNNLIASSGTITVSDSTCSGVGGGSDGGGDYDGGGGGAGSHIGSGGGGGSGGWRGTSGSGGSVYGSADDFVVEAGSCGGEGGGPYGGSGGYGGGAISITADNINLFQSSITANGTGGSDASYDDGGGGGGSGGTISINTNTIALRYYAMLAVAGGSGGNGGSYSAAGGGGGGGGAGGSIEIVYNDTLDCEDIDTGVSITYSTRDYSGAFSCLHESNYVNLNGGTGGSSGCGSSSCGGSGADGEVGSMNSYVEYYYDATEDYSETSNPNGAWSAGWSTDPTGTLNVYPDIVTSACGFQDWTDSTIEISNTPSFTKNTSTSDCTGISSGYVSLHPGCNADEYSVLRWTAPLDAECDVSINLYSGDGGETDASILLNGTLLDYFSVTSTDPSYTDTLTVSSGDTLDLAVGDLGSCGYDSTPFDFVVDCR